MCSLLHPGFVNPSIMILQQVGGGGPWLLQQDRQYKKPFFLFCQIQYLMKKSVQRLLILLKDLTSTSRRFYVNNSIKSGWRTGRKTTVSGNAQTSLSSKDSALYLTHLSSSFDFLSHQQHNDYTISDQQITNLSHSSENLNNLF